MSPGSLDGQLNGVGAMAIEPRGTGIKLSTVSILDLLGLQTCETKVAMILFFHVVSQLLRDWRMERDCQLTNTFMNACESPSDDYEASSAGRSIIRGRAICSGSCS